MSLFKKAEDVKTSLKVLAYGDSGEGKTTFALTFPKIAAIDSEDGMTHYRNNPNLLYVLSTSSFADVEEAVEEVDDELSDEVQTLVIDSETKIYDNQQFGAMILVEKRARRKGQSVDDANLSQREWGKIKQNSKKLKASQINLASKGINIVSICQCKPITETVGTDRVVVGYRPDAARGIEYDYDIVVKCFTKLTDGVTTYHAEVLKDRTGVFKKGDIIDNPSFDYWKPVYENKIKMKDDQRDFTQDATKDYDLMVDEADRHADLKAKFMKLFPDLSAELKSKIVDYIESEDVDLDNVSHSKKIEKLLDLMN